MTITDTYHTMMVAPEQSLPTEQRLGVPGQGSEDLPITEQEEEAWIEKLKQLAGCVA